MSKKANPKLIGGFVIGAIVLLVAAVVFFGSSRLFTEVRRVVMFFEGSVQGLKTGAPVMFKGVTIGQVTDVNLLFDSEKLLFYIEVFAEFEPESFTDISPSMQEHRDDLLQVLMKKGLRAQLVALSFVTGQLAVQIDFFPNSEMKLVGLDKRYDEIPTVPSVVERMESTIKRVLDKLEGMAVDKIAQNLAETAVSIHQLATSPELKDAITNVNQALIQIRDLASNLDNRIAPLVSNLEQTSGAVRTTFEQAQQIFAEARRAVNDAEKTLSGAQQLLTTTNGVIQPGSPLYFELVNALKDVGGAARSLKALADMIERNPNILLFGRTGSGAQK